MYRTRTHPTRYSNSAESTKARNYGEKSANTGVFFWLQRTHVCHTLRSCRSDRSTYWAREIRTPTPWHEYAVPDLSFDPNANDCTRYKRTFHNASDFRVPPALGRPPGIRVISPVTSTRNGSPRTTPWFGAAWKAKRNPNSNLEAEWSHRHFERTEIEFEFSNVLYRVSEVAFYSILKTIFCGKETRI